MKNRLIPTEKYLLDCAERVGDDQESPVFVAHRKLLARLTTEQFQPPPHEVDEHSFRQWRREPVDAERELHVSVKIVQIADLTIVELRGLRVASKGVIAF